MGCHMKRFSLSLSILLVLAVFLLNSCSGLPGGTTTPPPGNANFTVTVTDAPPTGVSFVSFNVPITSVSLTSSTGAIVNVVTPSTPILLDIDDGAGAGGERDRRDGHIETDEGDAGGRSVRHGHSEIRITRRWY